MQLRGLFDDLREFFIRRFWLLAIGTGVAMIGAFLAFRLLTPWPLYEATTTVIISHNNPDVDWASLRVSEELAPTYAEWALRRPVLQGVIDELELPFSVGELRKRIHVHVVPRTWLMEISATDADPEQAAKIANETVLQLRERIAGVAEESYQLRAASGQQITDLESNISTAEDKLAGLSEQLVSYQPVQPATSEVEKLKTNIQAAEAELAELNDALAKYQAAPPPDTEIARYQEKIDQGETELEELIAALNTTQFTTEADLFSRRITAIQNNLQMWRIEIDRLYNRQRYASDAEFNRLIGRINTVRSNLSMWQAELDQLYENSRSASEAEFGQMTRQVNTVQSNLVFWRNEYYALQGQYANLSSVPLVVLEPAQPPTRALKPGINILVAGVTGFVFTFGVSFLMDNGKTLKFLNDLIPQKQPHED